MLAEIDGAMILGLLILLPLILWLLGWVFAIVFGTARFARHQLTKNQDTRARIERDIYRGMQDRGYEGPQPERRYETHGERQTRESDQEKASSPHRGWGPTELDKVTDEDIDAMSDEEVEEYLSAIHQRKRGE